MAQLSMMVNLTIYDKCCRKTVLSWTILQVDDEDTVKDYFSLVEMCKTCVVVYMCSS